MFKLNLVFNQFGEKKTFFVKKKGENGWTFVWTFVWGLFFALNFGLGFGGGFLIATQVWGELLVELFGGWLLWPQLLNFCFNFEICF